VTLTGGRVLTAWKVAEDVRAISWTIPAGAFLANIPAPCPSHPATVHPWAIVDPCPSKTGWGISANDARALFAENRGQGDPVYMRGRTLLDTPADSALVRLAVPSLGIAAGDVLCYRYNGRHSKFPEVYGRRRMMTLPELEVLRNAFMRGEESPWDQLPSLHPLVDRNWGHDAGLSAPAVFLKHPNRWGKRKKAWVPRLMLVQPVAPEAVVPIIASSDDAAIFELLCQSGGRMPRPARV
jgi:hypothetical protein